MPKILLETMFRFAGGNPGSNNMRLGEQLFDKGMLLRCGATEKSERMIKLHANCMQTAGLKSPPHIITGILRIETSIAEEEIESEFFVEKMDCSCKTGESHSCKHIVAALLFCNRLL